MSSYPRAPRVARRWPSSSSHASCPRLVPPLLSVDEVARLEELAFQQWVVAGGMEATMRGAARACELLRIVGDCMSIGVSIAMGYEWPRPVLLNDGEAALGCVGEHGSA